MYAEYKVPLVSTLSIESEGVITGSGGFRSRLFPRKMEFNEELLDIYGPSFLTRYNNQSSILMCSVTCKDMTDVNSNTDFIMLLHDTRVFYFKADDEKWLDLDETIHELTSMFLNLLTTDKYRLLTAFYSFFQNLDKVCGSALLFLLVFAHEVDDWGGFFRKYWAIFFVWMVELYYTAMEYSVKLWILTRVSLYFGFVILFLYYVAFKHCGLWDYENQPMVLVLYVLRFSVFLIEQATTFCIDKELAFDISQGSIKPFRNMPFARSNSFSRLQATILPDGVRLAVNSESYGVPRVHTPYENDIYGFDQMPTGLLDDCTEPIFEGIPDWSGMWVEKSEDGDDVISIEQCGDRFLYSQGGLIQDFLRADGTVENGLQDVKGTCYCKPPQEDPDDQFDFRTSCVSSSTTSWVEGDLMMYAPIGDNPEADDNPVETWIMMDDGRISHQNRYGERIYTKAHDGFIAKEPSFNCDIIPTIEYEYETESYGILRQNTPYVNGRWGYEKFPMEQFLEDCDTPISEGIPDMTGYWIPTSESDEMVVSVEQCGDRFLAVYNNVIQDLLHVDGTIESGLKDVLPDCTCMSTKDSEVEDCTLDEVYGLWVDGSTLRTYEAGALEPYSEWILMENGNLQVLGIGELKKVDRSSIPKGFLQDEGCKSSNIGTSIETKDAQNSKSSALAAVLISLAVLFIISFAAYRWNSSARICCERLTKKYEFSEFTDETMLEL